MKRHMMGKTKTMNEHQIRHMVVRFLAWPLPDAFYPDAGISYVRPPNVTPSGTNLLDAKQAEEMVRFLVDGMPK